jgi:hypothetical protein
MSTRVCLLANCLYHPDGGGHLWAYLHWALGLRALGIDVVWLEAVGSDRAEESVFVDRLRGHLARYALAERLALCRWSGEPPSPPVAGDCLDLEAASAADLLLNLGYNAVAPEVVARFRRSALVDLDPGATQLWVSAGRMDLAPHDAYFTIGEGVVRAGTRIPQCGIAWQHTLPPVALSDWPRVRGEPDAAYTTVTHWGGEEIDLDGRLVPNSKRDGFEAFLDLPARSPRPLELAIHFEPSEESERARLEARGWRVRDAHAVASTPWDYQSYVARSRGEFSCAKPVYAQLGSGWISDRTLAYLASGRPAIVQDTGPSRLRPAAGLLRFRSPDEAARQLEACEADYERHCAGARALAEQHFDARAVVRRILELTIS